jgi:hypothetical protein
VITTTNGNGNGTSRPIPTPSFSTDHTFLVKIPSSLFFRIGRLLGQPLSRLVAKKLDFHIHT